MACCVNVCLVRKMNIGPRLKHPLISRSVFFFGQFSPKEEVTDLVTAEETIYLPRVSVRLDWQIGQLFSLAIRTWQGMTVHYFAAWIALVGLTISKLNRRRTNLNTWLIKIGLKFLIDQLKHENVAGDIAHRWLISATGLYFPKLHISQYRHEFMCLFHR